MSALTMLFVQAAAGAALLQVQQLPWTPGKSICFTADTSLDGRAEVCVLDEQTLRIFGRLNAEPLHTVTLPPRTSAIDITDLEGDGTADLIAVQGDNILRYRLSGGVRQEADHLFSAPSHYSRADGYPFPAVLVVDRGAGPLIALPGETALELRSPTGERVDSYPIGIDAPYHVAIGKPFSYWVNQHSQTGPRDALELRVNSITSYKPLLPEGALPIDVAPAPSQRLGTHRQQWEAVSDEPESWPWFQVRSEGALETRALYRRAGAHADTTEIRIRDRGPGTENGDRVGPARHYPGLLLLHDGPPPDFNGDGYGDILLWKSPMPALTTSALARAATQRTWPLQLTTHQFLPERRRFAPTPDSTLHFDVPLAWIVTPSGPQGPIRAITLRDFDGDKRTDLAALTGEQTLTVWQAGAQGLGSEPAFTWTANSPVDEIVFESDLEGLGRTTLAVRAGSQLILLRPSTAPAP